MRIKYKQINIKYTITFISSLLALFVFVYLFLSERYATEQNLKHQSLASVIGILMIEPLEFADFNLAKTRLSSLDLSKIIEVRVDEYNIDEGSLVEEWVFSGNSNSKKGELYISSDIYMNNVLIGSIRLVAAPPVFVLFDSSYIYLVVIFLIIISVIPVVILQKISISQKAKIRKQTKIIAKKSKQILFNYQVLEVDYLDISHSQSQYIAEMELYLELGDFAALRKSFNTMKEKANILLSARSGKSNEMLDLSSLVQLVVTDYEYSSSNLNRNITLRVEEDCIIEGVAPWLSQIVHNFFDNAVKYSENGSDIWVTVQPSRDSIEFVVSNSDSYIVDTDLKRVFEKNYRVESDRSGYGVGLFLCANYVDRMNGKIKASSNGGVTHFKASFPAIVHQIDNVRTFTKELSNINPTHDTLELAPKCMSQINILLVEDHRSFSDVVVQYLERQGGFKCDVASDGIDALRIINENNNYQVVISDLNMPRMTGFELLDKLKESEIEPLLTILLSARGQHDDVLESMRRHHYYHFDKSNITQSLEKIITLIRSKIVEKNYNNLTNVDLLFKIKKYVYDDIKKAFSTPEIFQKYEYVTKQKLAGIFGVPDRKIDIETKLLPGESFSKFLIDKRLEKAFILLQNTEIPIVKIELMAGYGSAKGFRKAIKNKWGMTPVEIRKTK